MSYRVTYLKCAHCNEEYDNIYVSFGHPENDFDFVWECEKCDTENTLPIKVSKYGISHVVRKPHTQENGLEVDA